VGKDCTTNTAPLRSTADATCTSRCVSTPPTIGREVSTMVIAIPSLVEQVKGWHARPGKETVDEQAVGAASSITLRNGACLVQKPSNLPTLHTTTVDPPRCRQHSHWAICTHGRRPHHTAERGVRWSKKATDEHCVWRLR